MDMVGGIEEGNLRGVKWGVEMIVFYNSHV